MPRDNGNGGLIAVGIIAGLGAIGAGIAAAVSGRRPQQPMMGGAGGGRMGGGRALGASPAPPKPRRSYKGCGCGR